MATYTFDIASTTLDPTYVPVMTPLLGGVPIAYWYKNVGKTTGPEDLTNYYTDAACTIPAVFSPNPPFDSIEVVAGSTFTGTSGTTDNLLSNAWNLQQADYTGGLIVDNTRAAPGDVNSFRWQGHADVANNPIILYSNPVAVTSGKEYNVAFWSMTDGLVGSTPLGDNTASFALIMWDANTGTKFYNTVVLTDNAPAYTWQQTATKITIPSGTTSVLVGFTDGGSGGIFFGGVPAGAHDNPASYWWNGGVEFFNVNSGTNSCMTIDNGAVLAVTGSNGVFNPKSKQFSFAYTGPSGNILLQTASPTFKFGSILKTKYSDFSFYPALPLGEQTLPAIVGDCMGTWSMEIRNSGGGLQVPVFPPQLVPHKNGAIDGQAEATCQYLTAGRYTFTVINSTWVENDSVELYAELELGTSLPSAITKNDWTQGGGTANSSYAYRWYRASVVPTTQNLSSTILSSEFVDEIASAVSASISTDLSAEVASAVTADILASNAPLNIVQTNPVVRGTQLTIVQGDDYDTSTGQPVVFTDNGTWPALTGAEVKFTVAYWQNVNSTLVLSCICNTHVGPPQTVNVPLTKALTYTLTPGAGYVYDVRAKLPNNEIRSLVGNGNLMVNAPITTGF